MTVGATTPIIEYAGDSADAGVTGTFTFAVPFDFYATSTLAVIVKVDATGVETLKTITTNYTVSGGAGTTGTVTFGTAPATGETVRIMRWETLVQDTNL